MLLYYYLYYIFYLFSRVSFLFRTCSGAVQSEGLTAGYVLQLLETRQKLPGEAAAGGQTDLLLLLLQDLLVELADTYADILADPGITGTVEDQLSAPLEAALSREDVIQLLQILEPSNQNEAARGGAENIEPQGNGGGKDTQAKHITDTRRPTLHSSNEMIEAIEKVIEAKEEKNGRHKKILQPSDDSREEEEESCIKRQNEVYPEAAVPD